MASREFESVEPFGVDAGELDGLSPAECFTLGVEWSMVVAKADVPEAFEQPVHAVNATRLRGVLDHRKRKYTLTYMRDDVSESWMWLRVEPKE